jgi:hypothetical protein
VRTPAFTLQSVFLRDVLEYSVDDHGSPVIYSVGFSVRPKHLCDQNCDHHYSFKLSLVRERDAQSSGRRPSALHVRLRAVPRANRTLPTAHTPNHSATSGTTARRFFAPSPPWQCSFAGASQRRRILQDLRGRRKNWLRRVGKHVARIIEKEWRQIEGKDKTRAIWARAESFRPGPPCWRTLPHRVRTRRLATGRRRRLSDAPQNLRG